MLLQYSYTSGPINDFLRDGKSADSKAMQRKVAEMDSAISKNSLSEDVEVFRGVGTNYLGLDLSSEDAIKKVIGKTVSDPAFLSTTISENVAQIYSRGVVLKMTARKNENVGFMDTVYNGGRVSDILQASKDGDSNHELMFGRNKKLKFKNYMKKKDSSGKEYFEISVSME